MTIVSTFFSGRAGVRAAKAELGGKVIDNGAGAETGKRWELQYEAGDGSSRVVTAMAMAEGAEVINVELKAISTEELSGIPVAGADPLVLDDVVTAIDELEQIEQAPREVLPTPKGLRYSGTRKIVLSDRKSKAIMVTVKRNKTAARLAAHMAK